MKLRIATLGFFLLLAGCEQTKSPIATDAGDKGGCSEQPSIACSAVAPGPASCSGQTSITGNGAALPTDASFPTGCQAYFRGQDCSSRGFCTCDVADDAGNPAHWNCHDAPDGGS